MRKVFIFIFLLGFIISLNAVRISGDWEFHQYQLDNKIGSTMILNFARGDNVKDVPRFLWGCQITCGMIGTWALKGNFLYITIMGKSSFYLIRVSENEWQGVGHIFYYPAKCNLYKIQ